MPAFGEDAPDGLDLGRGDGHAPVVVGNVDREEDVVLPHASRQGRIPRSPHAGLS